LLFSRLSRLVSFWNQEERGGHDDLSHHPDPDRVGVMPTESTNRNEKRRLVDTLERTKLVQEERWEVWRKLNGPSLDSDFLAKTMDRGRLEGQAMCHSLRTKMTEEKRQLCGRQE
jgi:hypothetical protein